MATYREGHQAFSRAAPSARRQMWSVMKFKWIGFLNHLFYERRYIASAPSLSNAAELSKSCGLVGVLDGRVEGGAEIGSGMIAESRTTQISANLI